MPGAADLMTTEVKFKPKIFSAMGHWWGVVDIFDGVTVAAPLGAIETTETKNLLSSLNLCRYYWLAGILGDITGPIIRSNDERVLEVIPGTSPDKAYLYVEGGPEWSR